MADVNNQGRFPAPPQRGDGPQIPRSEAQPWDYERHLEYEHNLLVEAEQGWPTAVKRFRLVRPMEGRRPERTLAVFTGTRPAAMAHFFHYIHPTPPTSPRPRPYAARRP